MALGVQLTRMAENKITGSLGQRSQVGRSLVTFNIRTGTEVFEKGVLAILIHMPSVQHAPCILQVLVMSPIYLAYEDARECELASLTFLPARLNLAEFSAMENKLSYFRGIASCIQSRQHRQNFI